MRNFFLGLLLGVWMAGGCEANAGPRLGSYAQQRSDGSPLVVAGKMDSAKVMYLADTFDDVVLSVTPFAQDVSGQPRWDVPTMLRQRNARVRVWLYISLDPWLPQGFPLDPNDHSGYRDMQYAMASGNGYLYDTQGRKWWDKLANLSLNMGDAPTMLAVGDVAIRLARVYRVDGILFDNAQRSKAWASNGDHVLDVQRAGFRSLSAMDSAASDNMERMMSRIHAALPCVLIAANCGPEPKMLGVDMDFREGLGSLISVADAKKWMASPGKHWLKMECYSPEECAAKAAMLKQVGGRSTSVVSGGPDNAWPPYAPSGAQK